MVVLMSALWVVFYPKRLESKALSRARASVASGENGGGLGENEIEIDHDQIIHKQAGKETKYNRESIKNITETDTSIFLFSSPLIPIIIPKKKVDSMDLIQLKKVLEL